MRSCAGLIAALAFPPPAFERPLPPPPVGLHAPSCRGRPKSFAEGIHAPSNRRLWNVVLVSRRFRNLCQGPQLLSSLDIVISGNSATVVQRARSLLAFFTAHARHMRDLWLDVQLPQGAPEQQRCEVAALVTGCLTACGAAGGALQTLGISAATPLGSTAWLQSLTSLQHLQELGECMSGCVRLPPPAMSSAAFPKAGILSLSLPKAGMTHHAGTPCCRQLRAVPAAGGGARQAYGAAQSKPDRPNHRDGRGQPAALPGVPVLGGSRGGEHARSGEPCCMLRLHAPFAGGRCTSPASAAIVAAPFVAVLQVGQLSRLTELRLNLCDYSGASLEQVAALPLQCLQLDRAPLPPCLAALTGLTLLSIAGTNEDDEAVLDRALPSLTNLRHLLLDGHGTPTFLPGSLTALTSLERLFLRAWSNGEPARFELPGGPWLLTLRWLVSGNICGWAVVLGRGRLAS